MLVLSVPLADMLVGTGAFAQEPRDRNLRITVHHSRTQRENLAAHLRIGLIAEGDGDDTI